MAAPFYTHRLTKLLEEFVIGAGLTLTISDAGAHVDLAEQLGNIEHAARQKGIAVDVQQTDGATVLRFSMR